MGSGGEPIRTQSRRAFLEALTGVALAGAARAAAFDEVKDRDAGRPPRIDLQRRYRADAQVMLLGMPLLHRESVGGGSVVWREFEGTGGARLLEFHGFSSPDRAAGLNRLGFIREFSRTTEAGRPECTYFGLMTAITEENVDAARNALHSPVTEQNYTAIDGRIASGETTTATARFSAPAAIPVDRHSELLDRARHALASANRVASDVAPDCAHSFLQVLADLLSRSGSSEARYIYSGRIYLLQLTRNPDGRAAAHFRQRRLIGPSEEVVRVTGRLCCEDGGPETEFRLWIPGGGARPLPLRIEYQPKSYLRLAFEAQPPAGV